MDAAVGSNGRVATASAVLAVNTSSRLPACAVFTFDPRSHKIKLGIHLDRDVDGSVRRLRDHGARSAVLNVCVRLIVTQYEQP